MGVADLKGKGLPYGIGCKVKSFIRFCNDIVNINDVASRVRINFPFNRRIPDLGFDKSRHIARACTGRRCTGIIDDNIVSGIAVAAVIVDFE